MRLECIGVDKKMRFRVQLGSQNAYELEVRNNNKTRSRAVLVGESREEIDIAECTWRGEGRAAPGYMLAAWRFVLGEGAK